MKPTLSIIGCGKVARTLGALWHRSGQFDILDLYSRSLPSAQAAKAFIGAGTAQENLAGLRPAKHYLIATPDDQIEPVAAKLANLPSAAQLFGPETLIFHCSGALSSQALSPLRPTDAQLASAHPIKSFPSEVIALDTFPGTICTLEGDQKATERLKTAFNAINAGTMVIDKENKALYHTSTSIVCNYLCSVLALGLECLKKTGLDQQLINQALQPLAQETLENVFVTGAPAALTGPIARGDANTLQHQVAAMKDFAPEYLDIFLALSKQTANLASQKLNPPDLSEIAKILGSTNQRKN